MRKSIAMMAVVWTLTACASGAPPTPEPTPTLSVTPWTLLDCPPVPPLRDGTMPALLTNHSALTDLYRECGDKHRELVLAMCLLRAAPEELCRERLQRSERPGNAGERARPPIRADPAP